MTGPLATLGRDWDRFVEATTDFQVWLNPACAAALDRVAGGHGTPLFAAEAAE